MLLIHSSKVTVKADAERGCKYKVERNIADILVCVCVCIENKCSYAHMCVHMHVCVFRKRDGGRD